MKKVLFINGKGGTGKTTAAVLIASAAAANGLTVGIEDIDPQQSLTAWIKNTSPENIELAKNGKNYSVQIIDTPPRLDEKGLHGALKSADIIIVVSTLSPNDGLTTERTIKLLKDLKVDDKARLLINMFIPGTLLAKHEKGITEALQIQKLKNHLSRRQAYQYVMLSGWKSLSSKERAEIFPLALEILSF